MIDVIDPATGQPVPVCSSCGGADVSPEAVRLDREDRGRKDDHGKDRWDLLPTRPLRSVVRVLGYGAERYGADNWRRVPDARNRYYAAALRHLMAWREGEILDESGHPHLAHAMCCLLFLAEGAP